MDPYDPSLAADLSARHGNAPVTFDPGSGMYSYSAQVPSHLPSWLGWLGTGAHAVQTGLEHVPVLSSMVHEQQHLQNDAMPWWRRMLGQGLYAGGAALTGAAGGGLAQGAMNAGRMGFGPLMRLVGRDEAGALTLGGGAPAAPGVLYGPGGDVLAGAGKTAAQDVAQTVEQEVAKDVGKQSIRQKLAGSLKNEAGKIDLGSIKAGTSDLLKKIPVVGRPLAFGVRHPFLTGTALSLGSQLPAIKKLQTSGPAKLTDADNLAIQKYYGLTEAETPVRLQEVEALAKMHQSEGMTKEAAYAKAHSDVFDPIEMAQQEQKQIARNQLLMQQRMRMADPYLQQVVSIQNQIADQLKGMLPSLPKSMRGPLGWLTEQTRLSKTQDAYNNQLAGLGLLYGMEPSMYGGGGTTAGAGGDVLSQYFKGAGTPATVGQTP